MSALKLVRELLDKVYHWHRIPSSVKAKAILSWLASFITLYTLLGLKVDMVLNRLNQFNKLKHNRRKYKA